MCVYLGGVGAGSEGEDGVTCEGGGGEQGEVVDLAEATHDSCTAEINQSTTASHVHSTTRHMTVT